VAEQSNFSATFSSDTESLITFASDVLAKICGIILQNSAELTDRGKLREPRLKNLKMDNDRIVSLMVAIPVESDFIEKLNLAFPHSLLNQLWCMVHNSDRYLQYKKLANPDREYLKIYVTRDNFKKFSRDGSAIVVVNRMLCDREYLAVIYTKPEDDVPLEMCGKIFVRSVESDVTIWFRTELVKILQSLCNEGLEYISRMGKLLGECSVCGAALSDDKSKARGIGPVCEKRMKKYANIQQVSYILGIQSQDVAPTAVNESLKPE
jgi:hypothetical protein